MNGLRIRKNNRYWYVPYLFVLPAFIIHLCLVVLPSFSTLVMSFYDWNGLGNAKFIGLQNFREIFGADKVVGRAVMNNLKWTAIFLVVPTTLAFIISISVSRINRGQKFFRTVYFLPYVVSAAVAGKIWTAYYNPYYGFNTLLARAGFTSLSETLWLGNPKIALYSVAFVDNWHWWGYVMVLFLGALQQIEPTLYEAARVDGASRFQEILHVALPGIRRTVAFVLIMTVMWSFLTFDYVYVMTNGGPANSTEILATWIYKNAFVKYRAGYANALCVIQCGICVVFYFLQRTISEKGGLNDEN